MGQFKFYLTCDSVKVNLDVQKLHRSYFYPPSLWDSIYYGLVKMYNTVICEVKDWNQTWMKNQQWRLFSEKFELICGEIVLIVIKKLICTVEKCTFLWRKRNFAARGWSYWVLSVIKQAYSTLIYMRFAYVLNTVSIICHTLTELTF